MVKKSESATFSYQPQLARSMASLQAGILLSYLLAEANGKEEVSKSVDEVCAATALGERRQDSAIKRCEKFQALSVKDKGGIRMFTLDTEHIKTLTLPQTPKQGASKGKERAIKLPKVKVTAEAPEPVEAV